MLTIATAKAARPKAHAYKLADERSLFLFVAPTGSKSWRMKFRYQGREQLMTFGLFPEISLADARAQRDAAREQLRAGINPAIGRTQKPSQDLADLFETRARAWHAHHRPHWSDAHAADVLDSLERDVFPVVGNKLLTEIDTPTVLQLLRAVEARGSRVTARRLRERISSIYALAISEGCDVTDPAAIVAKALRPPPAPRHHPALLELAPARDLLAACRALERTGIIPVLASEFLALTAVRLACVRGMRWGEVSGVDWNQDDSIGGSGGDAASWSVPPARVKLAAAKKLDAGNAHVVPLSAEAVAILRAARAIAAATGDDDLVFVGRAGGPIGEAAIGALYVRAGFGGRHVPHGWRATFSTVMNYLHREDRDAIDQALGHVGKGKVEAAYNRAAHLERRRWLFERWGALLTGGAG